MLNIMMVHYEHEDFSQTIEVILTDSIRMNSLILLLHTSIHKDIDMSHRINDWLDVHTIVFHSCETCRKYV